MRERALDCLATAENAALPLYALPQAGLAAWLDAAGAAHAPYLRAAGFAAKPGQVALLPAPDGLAGAVLGLGAETGPWPFGGASTALPAGTWRLEPGEWDAQDAALGWCLGAYRFQAYAPHGREPARLVLPAGAEQAVDQALDQARATWWVRDLVNTPAADLGPRELADAVEGLAGRYGASFERIEGDALETGYPAVAAVGRGATRPPCVAVLRWTGPGAEADAPLLSLCGKGVCFDSGGYDLKPPAAMLRMKKDMGGAALLMGLARLVMAAGWPVRLVLRVGCVENMVSGHAMRPGDVLRTRKGLTIEIGNTDAEGRLVLADLLADATDEAPALLLNAATLTGAARVALGPDLPVLFSNDDAVANAIQAAGTAVQDPVWRLPLWQGYAPWLDSKVASLNNVAGKPMAGAIVAALFLQRFVPDGVPWAHLDTYAWNDATRPGRPEGGEALGLRALFRAASTLIPVH